jgi:hypothetical protein
MLEIWKHALDSLDEGCPATLVMVVDHTGSAPGTTGATMVVSELGSAGTVGGGAVENEMTTRVGLHAWALPSRGYKKKKGGSCVPKSWPNSRTEHRGWM